MTKYAKIIDETCAAGAPDMKDGKPYTAEMAIADGYLPLVEMEPDKELKNPTVRYRVQDGKVIEYYIEGEITEEEKRERNQRMIEQTSSSMN